MIRLEKLYLSCINNIFIFYNIYIYIYIYVYILNIIFRFIDILNIVIIHVSIY